MNTLSIINVLLAGIIGIITAIVSWRVLRSALKINNPALGICAGALTALGLGTNSGGNMSALLIPYEALGITLVLMFLTPFFKGKKGKNIKPLPPEVSKCGSHEPEDPWMKEARLRGKMSNRF